jgi:hypothetical protein
VSVYHLIFEWPAAAKIRADTRRIEAPGLAEARLQAAMIYASESFEQGLPVRYYLLNGSGGRVFTYPDEA